MSKVFVFAAVSVAMCCVPLPAIADGKAPAAARSYFYDGGKRLLINPEPGLVAEFGGPDTQSAVKKAAPGAEELQAGVGGPRLFKAPASSFKPRTATGTATSPVFRLGTTPGGRLMALPGGMVVTFKPEWSDSQVREWAARKGHEVQQRLEISGNWYVLRTDPGLASLDAANALHESGAVVSASPNWWKETVTR